MFITRLRPSDRNGLTAINRAFYISAVISAVARRRSRRSLYLPATFAELRRRELARDRPRRNPRWIAIGAVVIGIVLAAVIQALTGYFTETEPPSGAGHRQVVARPAPATVMLAGISVGFESAVYSALVIGAGVFGAFLLGGGSITLSLFAVALAGYRPAHHRRRHRRDGHLRPDLATTRRASPRCPATSTRTAPAR